MKHDYKDFRDKAKAFLNEKGLYLTLMLCAAVIGLAAAIAYLPGKNPPQPTPEPPAETVSHSEDESLSALKTPSPTPELTPAPVPDVTPPPSLKAAAAPKPSREKAIPPVDGSIQWRFAVDELIFSRTLNQWMTHRGVDLAAPLGAEVRCPWGGVVEDIYEDDSLGITVRVSHSQDRETFYSNLRKDCPVSKGDRLEAGDVVGRVGETAVAECGEDPHLHFELHIDGNPVDPGEHILFPSSQTAE